MNEPILEAKGISIRFGGVDALNNVSFALGRGEVLGLAGDNGAGKSTLIKILLGLLEPTGGRAAVLGHDCATDGARIRTLTGYMPEHDCLPPDVTATEFVTHMGRMSVGQVTDMIYTSDVFLHRWDLARATGQDETLDSEKCAAMLEGMLPMDEALRQSGHYGPRVHVPDDADVQTKLLAFIGRTP